MQFCAAGKCDSARLAISRKTIFNTQDFEGLLDEDRSE